MLDQFDFGHEFFEKLRRIDERIARAVAVNNCPACGGRLHQGNYKRKPRGALIAPEGEASVIRFSLCCGREGCRKRALPPSVRFLGRRVYLGAVVIVASMVAQALRTLTELRAKTGVPARTVRRWLGWWGGPFITTEVFVTVCARMVGVSVADLPSSIVDRLGGSPTEQVRTMLDLLAPLTTKSVPDGARYLRDAA
ncbi:MAG: hypothetical protein JWO56_1972 [Acidobacteria bacterium]|nr:hypothetical protein [Acidobacteriota bacterium]